MKINTKLWSQIQSAKIKNKALFYEPRPMVRELGYRMEKCQTPILSGQSPVFKTLNDHFSTLIQNVELYATNAMSNSRSKIKILFKNPRSAI